jgi:hypothetical protein
MLFNWRKTMDTASRTDSATDAAKTKRVGGWKADRPFVEEAPETVEPVCEADAGEFCETCANQGAVEQDFQPWGSTRAANEVPCPDCNPQEEWEPDDDLYSRD